MEINRIIGLFKDFLDNNGDAYEFARKMLKFVAYDCETLSKENPAAFKIINDDFIYDIDFVDLDTKFEQLEPIVDAYYKKLLEVI